MSLKTETKKSTSSYSQKIEELKNAIADCDTVIIGAGAGLSTAAGFDYSGVRFDKYFSDFKAKYGFGDMYSGGFYRYKTDEEYWAYWSRYIYLNRYCNAPNGLYPRLFDLVKEKDYFVITTNVDHQFQKAGFDKKRLFYTQGDYGLFQCSIPCRNFTLDNEEIIKEMVKRQKNMKIPTELIPKCPYCGAKLATNLRCDDKFAQDEGWHKAAHRYADFLRARKNQKLFFLELGVGYNTPSIIKYPFWQMTYENKNARYACINIENADAPSEIRKQSICIDGDLYDVINRLL